MSNPSEPAARIASIEVPEGIDHLELRSAIEFLNPADKVAFASYLGAGGSGTVDTTVTDGSPNAVSGNAVFDHVAARITANNTTARTLINATISGAANTLTNIGTAALTFNYVGIAGVTVRLGQSITAPTILESMGSLPGAIVTRKTGSPGAWEVLQSYTPGLFLRGGGITANLTWALVGEVFRKTAPLHGTVAAVGAVLNLPVTYNGPFADERGIHLTTSAGAGNLSLYLMGDPADDGTEVAGGIVADAAPNDDITVFVGSIAAYINANHSADLTATSDGSYLNLATVATGASATVSVSEAGDPGPDDMDQMDGSDSGSNSVAPISSANLDVGSTYGGRYPVACYLQVIAGTTAEDVLIVQKTSYEDGDDIYYVYTPLFRSTSGKGVGGHVMLPDTGAAYVDGPYTPIPSPPENDLLNPLIVFVGSDGTGDLGAGVEVTVTAFIGRV